SLVGCLLQDSFARLGGFVYNAGGEVVLDDTIVEGTLSHPTREHNAAEGGAIFNAGGTVSFRNGSRISYSRTTGDGGAVSQIGSTAVTAIDDSEVLENTAGTGFGGGIHLVEGALSISGSVFVGNSVEDGIGGAIALRPPTVMAVAPGDPGTGSGPSDGPAPSLETETLTIEETTVRGNSAPDCGGIAILGDFSARIEDSVIGDPDLGDEEDDGNFTSGRGGGLCRTIDQGVAVLINTVVAGNQAQRGGGIFLSGGSLELSDGSRVRGNSAEEGGGIYVDPDPDDDPTTLSLVNSV